MPKRRKQELLSFRREVWPELADRIQAIINYHNPYLGALYGLYLANPNIGRRQIAAAIGGRHSTIATAREWLARAGLIEIHLATNRWDKVQIVSPMDTAFWKRATAKQRWDGVLPDRYHWCEQGEMYGLEDADTRKRFLGDGYDLSPSADAQGRRMDRTYVRRLAEWEARAMRRASVRGKDTAVSANRGGHRFDIRGGPDMSPTIPLARVEKPTPVNKKSAKTDVGNFRGIEETGKIVGGGPSRTEKWAAPAEEWGGEWEDSYRIGILGDAVNGEQAWEMEAGLGSEQAGETEMEVVSNDLAGTDTVSMDQAGEVEAGAGSGRVSKEQAEEVKAWEVSMEQAGNELVGMGLVGEVEDGIGEVYPFFSLEKENEEDIISHFSLEPFLGEKTRKLDTFSPREIPVPFRVWWMAKTFPGPAIAVPRSLGCGQVPSGALWQAMADWAATTPHWHQAWAGVLVEARRGKVTAISGHACSPPPTYVLERRLGNKLNPNKPWRCRCVLPRLMNLFLGDEKTGAPPIIDSLTGVDIHDQAALWSNDNYQWHLYFRVDMTVDAPAPWLTSDEQWLVDHLPQIGIAPIYSPVSPKARRWMRDLMPALIEASEEFGSDWREVLLGEVAPQIRQMRGRKDWKEKECWEPSLEWFLHEGWQLALQGAYDGFVPLRQRVAL